ncbi:hypothetical protein GQ44DRAFT_620017 [Phaeosphaeriaceae sp. PMI808]|nr:hypothetical protein GQ44DRAFT_620017 [Phaeosphaeriaceae sp. PMI808]
MAHPAPHQQPSLNPNTLSSQWQQTRKNAGAPFRLSMRFIEVVVLAATMFIVSTSIHFAVQSLDSVYKALDRRARSPFTSSNPWTSIVIASVLLVGWHACLGRMSYRAVMEDSSEGLDSSVKKPHEGGSKGVSWGRVLGRIVVPLLLLSFTVHFTYFFLDRLRSPATFVVPNINDVKEIEEELRGWL